MIFIQKFAITCRVGLWNKQMPYFSSVSDEWSRDLKSVRYRNSVHVEEDLRSRCEEAVSHVKNVSSLDRLRIKDRSSSTPVARPELPFELPAPGNRSNERRYREKDLATTEEKKVGTGEKREGDEKSRGREK
ncbi:hypothetical protein TNCV_2318031 [Trichonephila clavipes]|nr:hypothetical protein TNCV_2318031 [Trichonephila clavipes]